MELIRSHDEGWVVFWLLLYFYSTCLTSAPNGDQIDFGCVEEESTACHTFQCVFDTYSVVSSLCSHSMRCAVSVGVRVGYVMNRMGSHADGARCGLSQLFSSLCGGVATPLTEPPKKKINPTHAQQHTH